MAGLNSLAELAQDRGTLGRRGRQAVEPGLAFSCNEKELDLEATAVKLRNLSYHECF